MARQTAANSLGDLPVRGQRSAPLRSITAQFPPRACVLEGGELGRRLFLAWKGHGSQGVFLIGPVDADDGGIVAQIERALFCSGILYVHRLEFELLVVTEEIRAR